MLLNYTPSLSGLLFFYRLFCILLKIFIAIVFHQDNFIAASHVPRYTCHSSIFGIQGKEIVMFVVTGGGRGVGKALAVALAARDRSVLIVGRDESMLMEVSDTSDLIDHVAADVSTSEGRQCLYDYLQDVTSIEGLVHNAGMIEPMMPLGQIDEKAWQKLMALNVDAPLFLSQRLMHQLSVERVLHIGSGAAHFPVAGWAPYCVSKAALFMLTRCWQLESQDIAFASVKPGIIDTDMMTLIRNCEHMDPNKLNFFKQLKENNQLISPETVALFLCWLLLDTDASEYVASEWDIYDENHHHRWLLKPHAVPRWEGL